MTAAVVTDYQEQTEALAVSTVAAVLALYVAMQAGELAPAVLVPAIAAVVATANATATTLADLAVSAQIEVATAHPQPPTGIPPRDDTERLTKAVETILVDLSEPDEIDEIDEDAEELAADEDDEPDELDELDEDDLTEPADDADDVAEPDEDDVPDEDAARMRLERLARSEPLETGQAVTVEIIDRLPVAEGWTRVLDADPCARCRRWAEDGRVFLKGHHFKRHYGCNCQMQIVTTEGTAS